MKGLKRFGVLLGLICFVATFVGCGFSKEEHEKTVAELKGVQFELDKAKFKLEKAKYDLNNRTIALKEAESRISGMEKSLADAKKEFQALMAQHKKEKLTLQAPLVGVSEEAAFLRQKVAELTHGLQTMEREARITREANEVLKGEVDVLTSEKNQLQDLLGDQRARLAELERQLKTFQDPNKKLKIDPLK